MSSPASSAEPPQPPPFNPAPLLIAFTLILLVCFFIGFCIVYMCRCCMLHLLQAPNSGGTASISIVRPPAASSSHGLDPLLLQTFPSFPYSSVKEYRKEKYGLECAICLLEFEEESLLRLLTACCHVFHQECIDLWLMTHKTCPVCRTELDSAASLDGKGFELGDINDGRSSSIADNEVRIDIKDGENDDNDQNQRGEEASEVDGESNAEKFSRSHSTGHSIVLIRGEGREGRDEEDDDKYTLRLPEDVKAKLFRGHHYAHSCSTYKEMVKHEPGRVQ